MNPCSRNRGTTALARRGPSLPGLSIATGECSKDYCCKRVPKRMVASRTVARSGASTPAGARRPRRGLQALSPPEPGPAPLAGVWIELDAGMPLPGPLELPTNVVLAPADDAADGLHRVRGHGHDGLRRRLAAEFLAMGFEVSQARHDEEGGLLAGPWVLEMRPPPDLAPSATLGVRGEVRIRPHAAGAFPVRAGGDIVMDA